MMCVYMLLGFFLSMLLMIGMGISGIWGTVECLTRKPSDLYNKWSHNNCYPDTSMLLILSIVSLVLPMIVLILFLVSCCSFCCYMRAFGVKSGYEKLMDLQMLRVIELQRVQQQQGGINAHGGQLAGQQYGRQQAGQQYGRQPAGQQYGTQQAGEQYDRHQVGQHYSNRYGRQPVEQQQHSSMHGRQPAGQRYHQDQDYQYRQVPQGATGHPPLSVPPSSGAQDPPSYYEAMKK